MKSRCQICGIEGKEVVITNDKKYSPSLDGDLKCCKECFDDLLWGKHWNLLKKIKKKLIGKTKKEVEE